MDRIQLRRDTSVRWAEVNPILLEGEVGFEIDTKLRKIGDGVNRWNDLEYLKAEGIVQELGDSENLTVSQKTITKELSDLASEIMGEYLVTKKEGVVYDGSLGIVVNATNGYDSFLIKANPNQTYKFSNVGSIGTIASYTMLSSMYAVGTNEGVIGKFVNGEKTATNCQYILVGVYVVDSIKVETESVNERITQSKDDSLKRVDEIRSKLYDGREISFIGDSISTYNGYGGNPYYPNSDVDDVEKTWWKLFLNRTCGILKENLSTGSSLVTNTYPYEKSQVTLVTEVKQTDIMVLAGGVNDCFGTYAELGTVNFNKAIDDLDESLFCEAYDKYVRIAVSKSNVVICVATSKVAHEYRDAMKYIALHYNAVFIDLTLIKDKIELIDNVHPNYSGMQMICEYVYNILIQAVDLSDFVVDNLSGDLSGKIASAELTKKNADVISDVSQEVSNISMSKKYYDIEVYNNNFRVDINNGYVNEFDELKTNEQIKALWRNGRITFNCKYQEGGTYDACEMYIKSPLTFVIPSFKCELDVVSDYADIGYGTSVRVGIMKDINNYLVANYDRTQNIVQILSAANGTLSSETVRDVVIEAPYTLVMSVDGDFVSCKIIKDGSENYIISRWVGGIMSMDNPSTLRDYSLCFGARASYATKDLVVGGIRGKYTSGYSFGADFHVLTYEDGSPIVNDNSIYFTSSIHSEESYGRGVAVYKMDASGYRVSLASILYFKSTEEGWYFGGNSSDVLYDRDSKSWIVQVTNFKSSVKTLISKTQTNILSGVHVIECQPMNVPYYDKGTWDFDIIKKDGLWYCVYSTNGIGIVKCSASDVLGEWTLVGSKTDGNEGCNIFKCNGKYYITTTNKNDVGLDIVDFETLEVIGYTKVSKWCHIQGTKLPHSWGQIFPMFEDGKTYYYMVVFSGLAYENMQYAYGDLWVFKSSNYEVGSEFGLSFNGIEIVDVPLVSTKLLPTEINFVVKAINRVG